MATEIVGIEASRSPEPDYDLLLDTLLGMGSTREAALVRAHVEEWLLQPSRSLYRDALALMAQSERGETIEVWQLTALISALDGGARARAERVPREPRRVGLAVHLSVEEHDAFRELLPRALPVPPWEREQSLPGVPGFLRRCALRCARARLDLPVEAILLGRRATGKIDRSRKALSVLVSPRERNLLYVAARSADLTVAEWIRCAAHRIALAVRDAETEAEGEPGLLATGAAMAPC